MENNEQKPTRCGFVSLIGAPNAGTSTITNVRAEMTSYVEREGQKKIIVGRGGEMIKKVGQTARLELEEMLEDRIHLFLFVKVRENWSEDPARYQDWGLVYNV